MKIKIFPRIVFIVFSVLVWGLHGCEEQATSETGLSEEQMLVGQTESDAVSFKIVGGDQVVLNSAGRP